MGAHCLTCNTYQPIKQNITTHGGQTNKKAADVIGFVLACGHEQGAEETHAYFEAMAKINAEYAAQARKLEKDRNTRLAATLLTLKRKEAAK